MNEMTELRQEIAKIMRRSRDKDRALEDAQRKIEREARRNDIMGILSHHVGRCRAIGMGELYTKVFKREWRNRINDTRDLRHEIEALQKDGRRICSVTDAVGGGYYLPATDSEWDAFKNRRIGQAARQLNRMRAMYRISVEEAMRQVQLVLEEAR